MDFLLLLLGIVLTAVIFTAVRMAQPAKMRGLFPSAIQSTDRAAPRVELKARTISITECETLRRCVSDSVTFVSINRADRQGRHPFCNAEVLTMTPDQFVNEVQWFPSSTCVVLYGDTDACYAVIATLQHSLGIPHSLF